MMKDDTMTGRMVSFIEQSPSPFHAVHVLADRAGAMNWERLDEGSPWKMDGGGRCFLFRGGSSLVLICPGSRPPWETGFRVTGTHCDSPGFRVKNAPEIAGEGFIRLNAEVYGSPLLATWMDRPLALAGRVMLSGGEGGMRSAMVNLNESLLTIPSLAIHMNRDANKGWEVNPQRDCLPVLGLAGPDGGRDALKNLLALHLSVPSGQILDYDLFLYDPAPGVPVGINGELLSCPRLDNLSSVFAASDAIFRHVGSGATAVMVCFNHEEVGSLSRQGADSAFLETVLERIVMAYGGGREEYMRALSRSFLLSLDAAHGVHPAWPDKSDPTNRPGLGRGVVIKTDSTGRYATDGEGAAVIMSLCTAGEVPLQRFYNRSDSRGGSTIGPVTASRTGMQAVDAGIPVLAMHSVRETCGVADIEHLCRLCLLFYGERLV